MLAIIDSLCERTSFFCNFAAYNNSCIEFENEIYKIIVSGGDIGNDAFQ